MPFAGCAISVYASRGFESGLKRHPEPTYLEPRGSVRFLLKCPKMGLLTKIGQVFRVFALMSRRCMNCGCPSPVPSVLNFKPFNMAPPFHTFSPTLSCSSRTRSSCLEPQQTQRESLSHKRPKHPEPLACKNPINPKPQAKPSSPKYTALTATRGCMRCRFKPCAGKHAAEQALGSEILGLQGVRGSFKGLVGGSHGVLLEGLVYGFYEGLA